MRLAELLVNEGVSPRLAVIIATEYDARRETAAQFFARHAVALANAGEAVGGPPARELLRDRSVA
jgi:hypothetical protein